MTPLTLSVGTLFHRRYQVTRAMGAGGMGAIYEVVDLSTSRRRALKVMLPSLVHDAELRQRFELEARVTADVESEHIVETFDAGVDEETHAPFLVMELLRGEDLRAVVERGALPASEVVLLLRQAAMALERTHDAGIVHRDLKPDNLFVTRRDDGSPHLKILDFGIAKLVAQSAESLKTTRSMGSPGYMAPEQIRGDGDIDSRADVYSLGHIAFSLLVGRGYWETDARGAGSVYPVLLKIAQGAKEPAVARARAAGVELPAAFDGWFTWATALDRAERADDVHALVDALADALGVTAAGAPRQTSVPRRTPVQASPHPSGATALTSSVAGSVAAGPRTAPLGLKLLFAGFVAVTGVSLLFALRPDNPPPTPQIAAPAASNGPSEALAPSARAAAAAELRASATAAVPSTSGATETPPAATPTGLDAGRPAAVRPAVAPARRMASPPAATAGPVASSRRVPPLSSDPSDSR